MIMNLPVTLAKEPRQHSTYYELKLGRQVIASGAFTNYSDAKALATLLDILPRS